MPQPAPTSAEGFHSYKRLQKEGKVAGMIAMPNCCLVRARRGLRRRPRADHAGRAGVGVAARARASSRTTTKVLLTHTHFDHVEALVEFAARETYVHEIELEAPYTGVHAEHASTWSRSRS